MRVVCEDLWGRGRCRMRVLHFTGGLSEVRVIERDWPYRWVVCAPLSMVPRREQKDPRGK